jgi:predicted HicB family RNase H-like nuclease
MAQEKDAKYQFRVPRSLLEKAVEKARRQDLSLAQVLRRLLREWVKEPSESTQRDD